MNLPSLSTSIGEIKLHEYQLALGERTWSFLHTGAVLTLADEQSYLGQEQVDPNHARHGMPAIPCPTCRRLFERAGVRWVR